VVWTGHGWLTNLLEPEQAIVRAGMFAAMAAMFLAVPGAFGGQGALFAVAYLVARLINLALDGSARGATDPCPARSGAWRPERRPRPSSSSRPHSSMARGARRSG
jgi:hypothetical protein